MKFKWKYNAIIYRKSDDGVLWDKSYNSFEEAQTAIKKKYRALCGCRLSADRTHK